MTPTRTAVTPAMVAVPATSDRMRQACGGTSGVRARRSIRTKAVSRATAAANAPTVIGDAAPWDVMDSIP